MAKKKNYDDIRTYIVRNHLGQAIYGPFKSAAEAGKWGESRMPGSDWYIQPVLHPKRGE